MTPFEKIVLVRAIKNISSGEKLLLLTIATHLGNDDVCYLSLTTLQDECCLARDNVSSNIKKLISKKYLQKLPPSAGFKSNRFVINFDEITEKNQERNTTSSKTLLVAKHYHDSSETLLDQERNTTSLVVKHYPKEQLNNKETTIKNNNKQKKAADKDTFSPSPSSSSSSSSSKKQQLTTREARKKKDSCDDDETDEEIGTVMPWELFPEYEGVKETQKHDEVELGESEIGDVMFWEMCSERLENAVTEK